MRTPRAQLDGLLRAEGRFAVGGGEVPWRTLLALLLAGGFGYGVIMGSFSLRPEQALYSGLKVPLLLLGSCSLCLPNFYVVNAVLGLSDDFDDACRGVVAAQATVAVCLAALSPVTLLVYASSAHYPSAVVMNGVIFAVATFGGQQTLRRHYAPLIARDARHRWGRRAWVTLYVFVAVQLAWVLRPFIGAPSMPPSFLRKDLWSNAYVEVANAAWAVFDR